jgi:hypothetical protein
MCSPSVYSHSSIVNKTIIEYNMKQVSEVKHRNCIITSTPTEQFPHMVTIIKAPKIRSSFLNSRYINIERCVEHIETLESERLINSKETYVKVQLREVVVVDEVNS